MGFITSVHEVYYGRSKELLEIEKQLGKFRSKYLGQTIFAASVNEDEDLIKFNRMIEDFTGFNPSSITVIASNQYNAFTFPIGARFDTNISKNIRITKKNLKMDPKAEYCLLVFIYSGLIFSEEFTDGEILAILLHEIGHNFSGGVVPIVGMFDMIKKICSVLTLFTRLDSYFYTSNAGSKIYVYMNKVLMNIPFLAYIMYALNNILSLISAIGMEAISIIDMATLGLSGLLRVFEVLIVQYSQNPVSIFFDMMGYGDEGFADQYVAMNGYGAEFSSGMSKLEFGSPQAFKKFSNSIPIIGALANFSQFLFIMLISPFNPHALLPARLKSCQDLLKIELNNNKLDPKVKKRIEKDMASIQKDIDKLDLSAKESATDPYAVNKLYYSVMFKVFGGDIKHHLFKFSSPEEIDKRMKLLSRES